jgi:hypothetical protein
MDDEHFLVQPTVWTAGYELTSLANISPQAVLPAACKDVSWAEEQELTKGWGFHLGDFHGSQL